MAGRVKVGGEDLRAGAGGESGEEDADGPLADDEDGFVGLEIEIANALVDGVDGLDEGRLLKGDAVGDFDEAAADDPGHDADIFGKAAAGGLEAGGHADALVVIALRGGLFAAVITAAAGGVVEDHDAVVDFKALDALAGGGDHPGDFVAEDAGGGMGAGVDLFEVGAAHAAAVHADEDFAGADFGDGDGLNAHVIDTAVDGGAHDRGDGCRALFLQFVGGCRSHGSSKS